MKTYYKLTDQNMRTYNGYQWELGVTRRIHNGDGPLCSRHWLHVYGHPLVAVLMNVLHANIYRPRLFECRAGRKILRDGPLKSGVKSLTLLREIALPILTTEQLVEVAIRCAMTVYHEPSWIEWANKWLSGEDRSADAAYAAAWAARAAADAAYAAYAAAWAADAAARAARAAADAARAVARAAAYEARAAAYAASTLDLFAILEQVVNGKVA